MKKEDKQLIIVLSVLATIILTSISIIKIVSENETNKICQWLGYNESTDYKNIPIANYKIECDYKTLNKMYSITYDRSKECVQTNKWGDCIKHTIKKYESLWEVDTFDISKQIEKRER